MMLFGSPRVSLRRFYYIGSSLFPSSSGSRSTSAFLSSTSNLDPTVSLDFNRDASLAVLTLCNTKRRNALTYSMMHQLDVHIKTLQEWCHGMSTQNNSRALILTGSGGTFCAGLDIQQHDENDRLRDGREMAQHMTILTNCIHSLPVLSVAAVDGNAIGGGAELTTCTDLVVLSRQSAIKFVHASRGASPGWGGGRRLVNRVGRRKALRMLLLGEAVLGEEETQQLDYADYVADEGESSFDAAIRLIADPIIDLPCSKSVRAIKRVASIADGDEKVINTISGKLRYMVDEDLEDKDTSVKTEIDAFTKIWGGKSNRELIQQTRDRLKDKKTS